MTPLLSPSFVPCAERRCVGLPKRSRSGWERMHCRRRCGRPFLQAATHDRKPRPTCARRLWAGGRECERAARARTIVRLRPRPPPTDMPTVPRRRSIVTWKIMCTTLHISCDTRGIFSLSPVRTTTHTTPDATTRTTTSTSTRPRQDGSQTNTHAPAAPPIPNLLEHLEHLECS
jgi:hypothetical protein